MFQLANIVYTLKYIYVAVIHNVVVTILLLLLLLWIDWNRLAIKLVPFYCRRPYELLTVLNLRYDGVCLRLLPRRMCEVLILGPETGWSVQMFVGCINRFIKVLAQHISQRSTQALFQRQGYWWIVTKILEYCMATFWQWNWGAKERKTDFRVATVLTYVNTRL